MKVKHLFKNIWCCRWSSALTHSLVRLNLIRSVVELEVVISHAKETEVIVPEKNNDKNIYQVDPGPFEVVVVS